jgi:hypothetical protein
MDPGLKLGMLHSELQTGIHSGLKLGKFRASNRDPSRFEAVDLGLF